MLKLKSLYFFTSTWKFCSYVLFLRTFQKGTLVLVYFQDWQKHRIYDIQDSELLFRTFLEGSIRYYCSSPFLCFLSLSSFSHLSSCLLVYPSYFSSPSLHFSSTYSISSVHRTRCSRLWCHPLADSKYVLLSPGFNFSEQQGFERTVSWKDTIQKTGRVLQRKETPPCRCLRQTHTSIRDATCLTKHRRKVA